MSENARSRIYLAVIVLLLLVIAAMAYKFIVAGSVQKAEDGRVAILLEPGERDFALREMRGFVAGLQKIADGLSRNDMKAVADAARAMGMGVAHDAPLALVGKLPLEFKTLGFSVHRDFDGIAADAETVGDPKHTLAQISGVLQKCVACHNTYQIRTAAAK
ncbi:MAG: hypothetical protein ACM3PU_08650 [Gemmatimonadota bacterium]